MKPRQAFTLIEVMVVLSILAIIAVLAYSYFGSTMREAVLKQAAVQVYNDMRMLSDAVAKYEMDGGTLTNPGVNKINLLAGGYLKGWPSPPESVQTTNADYDVYATYDEMDGGSNNDAAIVAFYFSDEFCDVFMGLYASAEGTLQTAQWDYEANGSQYPGAVLGKGAQIYGIRWASADVDFCEVEWVLEYKD